MPLYEYRCHSCGKTIEVIQKFSDEPLAVHEDCGGALEKLISRSAIQFKGSGWYVNDYGKGGVLPKSGDSKPSESSSADSKPSGDSKPTESKTADSKTTESKSTESKPAESSSKPAATTASSDKK